MAGVGRYDDGDPTGTMGPGTIGEKAAVASNDVRLQFELGEISADDYREQMADIEDAKMAGDDSFFEEEDSEEFYESEGSDDDDDEDDLPW